MRHVLQHLLCSTTQGLQSAPLSCWWCKQACEVYHRPAKCTTGDVRFEVHHRARYACHKACDAHHRACDVCYRQSNIYTIMYLTSSYLCYIALSVLWTCTWWHLEVMTLLLICDLSRLPFSHVITAVCVHIYLNIITYHLLQRCQPGWVERQ